ncbi:related to haloacetate dehalogenase H-1 [Cephalotrichum gorgonifer]|uniref:Related to haloacetate dehalogenase H-1 n=1 Tax=Cephalotrichum gorgonifer TaxID=2041049 RepID=A0AAE8MUM9_9PEZI|nr:related to haloacetate dehalogenase H-1 [Cephalotrichum gorgonifer]
MFDSFEPFAILTQSSPEVIIRGLTSGSASSPLPPLLLLHGFPQTLHIWHLVAPELLDKYTVVLMDIRGYGESSKPDALSNYAKSSMARDCIAVMDKLGFTSSFFVCAHDRGARVTHKLCVDHPDRVRKAILLDISPTLHMYSTTNFEFAKAYFHWFFLIQPEPFPETFIAAEPSTFARVCLGARVEDGAELYRKECYDAYLRNLSDPATIHAMCHDYRAGATLDLDEAKDDLANGRLVKCPLLVLWAKHGVIERCFDPVKEWRAVTQEGVPVEGYSVDSDHYLPEHAPEDVVSAIVKFLQ